MTFTFPAESVIGLALNDFALSKGTRRAPAVEAHAHVAAWLTRHGYAIVRAPRPIESGAGGARGTQ